MLRRWTTCSLAAATLLSSAGCGGRLFHHKKKCDSPSARDRDDLGPRGQDFDPGTIRPRDSDTIPSPSLPTTPGPRTFDPVTPDGRRLDTFSPTRPGPRLEEPLDPYLPPAAVPSSPGDLPRGDLLPPPTESRKQVEPTPESHGSKKLILAPDGSSDPAPPATKSDYTPTRENGLPLPDRSVLLDPVSPGGPLALPRTTPEPEPAKPHTANAPTKPEVMPEAKPEVKLERGIDLKVAVGVPGIVAVTGYEGVYSGRRPPAIDGLDWLQKAGFRTVVYLHDPKADTGPAAELCAKRGMKFVGIPVAADRVKAAATAFDAAVADAAGRPVYVCDPNGLWAGTLWYAHFRAVGNLNADAAKVRAQGLGLADPDTSDEQRKLWDAAQEYLRTR